jgi:hypothetical protein
VASHDAKPLANRIEDPVVACQGTGVAVSGSLSGRTGADLHHKYRLVREQRLLGSRHERCRTTNAFHHATNQLGAFILDHEADVVRKIEVDLIAARDRVRKSESPHRSLVKPKLKRAARLEDHSDRASGESSYLWRWINQQSIMDRNSTHTIRAGKAQTRFVGQRPDRCTAFGAFLIAPFTEARCEHECTFQAMRRSLAQHGGNAFRRNYEQRQIDRILQCRKVRINFLPPQFRALRID